MLARLFRYLARTCDQAADACEDIGFGLRMIAREYVSPQR